MGLLTSVGIGIGAAAQAAQPFILNMQQAEIQKLRDERMAEIAKGTARYSAELDVEYAPKKQAALAPGLLAQQKEEQKIRYSPETIAGEKALSEARRDPQEILLRKLQIAKADLELNRSSEEAKIPAAELKLFDSLGKRASSYESAILKAQAEGNFDANSESGKKMLSDYQSILKQQESVISKYIKSDKGDGKEQTDFDPSKFDRPSSNIKSEESSKQQFVETITPGQQAAAQRRDELANALFGKIYSTLNAGEKARVERESIMASNRSKAGY